MSPRILLEVVYNPLDTGCCLYLDNWYTSPKLDDSLCTRKTDAGTMGTNGKELPDFMKRTAMQRGKQDNHLVES
jgi:hypothetical protein